MGGFKINYSPISEQVKHPSLSWGSTWKEKNYIYTQIFYSIYYYVPF